MLRERLTRLIELAVTDLHRSERFPAAEVPVAVEDPKSPEHGDFACNFALIAAKSFGMNPRAIAELLQPRLMESGLFESVEIAGPGFLNMRLRPKVVAEYVEKVLALGGKLAQSESKKRVRWNIEFVSVNPNGPITVGSGRGAAFGDTLSRVMEAAGNGVEREYYVNDGVNSEQMRLFAESVRYYYERDQGKPDGTFPENGYRGEYVEGVAQAILAKGLQPDGEPTDWFQRTSQEMMIQRQREDLATFGVQYKTWFSEQDLHNSGAVASALRQIKQAGHAEEREGALYLLSERLGDEKDRVLVRADGRPTYLASDVAYLKNKFERGYDRLMLILGPDHHGYINRLKAATQALGYDPARLEIVIFQIVRFVKDGEPAPMRKRDGNIYELRDLMREIGRDVVRFFYLMRSHDTHMDFDIDLAKQQSEENPMYYAQYAHARLCSVIDKAAEVGFDVPVRLNEAQEGLLEHPKELALIRKILDLPHETARCAEDYGVHRLTTYAVDLARAYHHFYDACRVVQPDQPELTRARLALCKAAQIGLQGVFGLLGISAPERMTRDAVSEESGKV